MTEYNSDLTVKRRYDEFVLEVIEQDDARQICYECDDNKPARLRYSLGLPAGYYCDGCWDKSGYRKEDASGFDPDYAGESYEEDW